MIDFQWQTDRRESVSVSELYARYQQASRSRPVIPSGWPGMPAVGPNFVRAVRTYSQGTGIGEPLVSDALTYNALYEQGFTLPVTVGKTTISPVFVPGHLAGSCDIGPRRAPVMVIGKHPGKEEVKAGRNFVGPTSLTLWQTLMELGVSRDEMLDWYVTNLIKFTPPQRGGAIPKDWLLDAKHLLQQEIQLVRPDYILLLGADACRAVVGCGDEAGRGRIFPLRWSADGTTRRWVATEAVTSIHPARLSHTPELIDEFRSDLAEFVSLLRGRRRSGAEPGIDHGVIRTTDELRNVVDEILASGERLLSVDAEWHGARSWSAGAYLRTVQFSHKPKFARCVELRLPGGYPNPSLPHAEAVEQLRRLLLHPEMRIGGHFLKSDIPWIHRHLGIDMRPRYAAAESAVLARTQGGWAMEAAVHAVHETWPAYGLERVRQHYVPESPPYELLLDKFRAEHAVKTGKDELDGFGEWDSPDFYSYACYDVDVPRRAIEKVFRELDCDSYGATSWAGYWKTHTALLAVCEMEEVGFPLDSTRIGSLRESFSETLSQLKEQLQDDIGWPTFNPASPDQCRAVLFGDKYAVKSVPGLQGDFRPEPDESTSDFTKRVNKELSRQKKEAKEAGRTLEGSGRKFVLPVGVQSFNLTPVLSTGTPPKDWSRLVARGQEDDHTPGTGAKSLGILSAQCAWAKRLRDSRFLAKQLSNSLAVGDGVVLSTDPDADVEVPDFGTVGLLRFTDRDTLRLHSVITPLMDTGRSSSSKPPLQNQTARRESDFARILGQIVEGRPTGDYLGLYQPRYKHPVRSILTAPPGHAIVESDYAGAELAGIMWMSQDPLGLEHVRRNSLPKSDPEFRDMHGHCAMEAFGLSAPAGKDDPLRHAAKAVNFGVPYGREALAIYTQCLEEGHPIELPAAEELVNGWHRRYSTASQFLGECRESIASPGFIVGSFGRVRRFFQMSGDAEIAHQERQAQNFPVQNLVADSVWTALKNFWDWRIENREPHAYKIALQIHDSVLLYVPFAWVPEIYRRIMPLCMCDRVPVWPCRVNGVPHPLTEPYHMTVDSSIMLRFGVKENEIAQLVKAGKDAEAVELLRKRESEEFAGVRRTPIDAFSCA